MSDLKTIVKDYELLEFEEFPMYVSDLFRYELAVHNNVKQIHFNVDDKGFLDYSNSERKVKSAIDEIIGEISIRLRNDTGVAYNEVFIQYTGLTLNETPDTQRLVYLFDKTNRDNIDVSLICNEGFTILPYYFSLVPLRRPFKNSYNVYITLSLIPRGRSIMTTDMDYQ